MKPVSYQSMQSSPERGYPHHTLDRVISTSKPMYCEKCGFASTDITLFEKHMIEHLRRKFYCFYCYKVSFTQAELEAHLKQHNKYPYICPHCGQGYMRRRCLLKHIDRLHNKDIIQTQTKPGVAKRLLPVSSSTLPSVPTSTPSGSVRVAASTCIAPSPVRPGEQKSKTLDLSLQNATNGTTELLNPLNEVVQPNRALTVSLPEEVTIPAGCMVELVEVKTVNGSKELKLRLVSQQENQSVIKDTSTMVSQNTALAKTFASKLNLPNTNVGMGSSNGKQCESKNMNVAERPAVISKSQSSQIIKDNCGMKRKLEDVISLDCQRVVPHKVPKRILNPVREGCGGLATQRETLMQNTVPPTPTPPRVTNRLTNTLHPENRGPCATLKTPDERKKYITDHSSSVSSRKLSDFICAVRDTSVALCHSQQNSKAVPSSLNVPMAAAPQRLPPASSHYKDGVTSQLSTLMAKTARMTVSHPTSVKVVMGSTPAETKVPAWGIRSSDRPADGNAPEPEGFPVISSVFSLSQRPEDIQSSMKPLVMALRGIVMDKSNGSDAATPDHVGATSGTEEVKEEPKAITCDRLKIEPNGEAVKTEKHGKAGKHGEAVKHSGAEKHSEVETQDKAKTQDKADTHDKAETHDKAATHDKAETHDKAATHDKAETHDKAVQHTARNHITVKEEDKNPKPTNGIKRAPALKTPLMAGFVAAPAVDPLVVAGGHDISKFLIVSLNRVDHSTWDQNQRGPKFKKTKTQPGVLSGSTVLHPTPLKVDQPVKRPGPNQPVVVLNHPKPRAPLQERPETVADTGTSTVVPKCQILKMRLSKVMGQKYEVLGCTVKLCP